MRTVSALGCSCCRQTTLTVKEKLPDLYDGAPAEVSAAQVRSLPPAEALLDVENFTLELRWGWRTSWLHGYAAPQGWPMQQRIMTKRQREILELRDACMLLVAQRGNQREMNGAPIMEVTLGPFTIWLMPGGVRRKLDVWHASASSTKVLDLGWSGDKLEIVSFRRGAWEQELLDLARRAPSR